MMLLGERKQAAHNRMPMTALVEALEGERVEVFVPKRQKECVLYREQKNVVMRELNKGVAGEGLSLEEYLK